MNEYTPSTAEVRARWTYSQTSYVSHPSVFGGVESQFDRWLASHDAELLATVTAPPATGDEREALARLVAEETRGTGTWPANEHDFALADAILARFTVTPKNGDNRT